MNEEGKPLIRGPETAKRCFVSAPYGVELGPLNETLIAHGVQPQVPHAFSVGTDWTASIRKAMEESDFVIGVLPTNANVANVAFDVGLACALGRRIVLISPSGVDWLPAAHRNILTIRASPENRKAIDFALTQLLQAPAGPHSQEAETESNRQSLGTDVDRLTKNLEKWQTSRDPRDLLGIVGDVLRSSGLKVMMESGDKQLGADFAVWSGALQPFIGNPLIVEVKTHIRNPRMAARRFRQIESNLARFGARWVLLIYATGPDPTDPLWRSIPPHVLAISLSQLLASLRVRSFPEVIRELRNRRVHGLRS